MRQLELVFLLAFFFSCSSPDVKSPAGKDSTAPAGSMTGRPAFMTLDTLLPFRGVWVNSLYVDAIRKTRSPRLSQNVTDKSFFIIPERTLQHIEVVYGFHEGGEGMVVVKDGAHFKLYLSDLSKFVNEMTPVSGDLLRIGDQSFVRLSHPDSMLYDQGILEELLFAGKYADPQGKSVSFGADGRVAGLDTLTYFSPQCDYTEDAEDFETVFMGRRPGIENMTKYGYRFDGDSLIFYRLNQYHYDTVAKEYDLVSLGDRLQSLVRVRVR